MVGILNYNNQLAIDSGNCDDQIIIARYRMLDSVGITEVGAFDDEFLYVPLHCCPII